MTTPPDARPTDTARIAPGAYRILTVLALANLMNFYDRTVPAVVVEAVKAEFGLTDAEIGVLSSGFTVVYALAGIALGRMADRGSRRRVMAGGLVAWSLFTALSGGAWSFASLLLFRLGVGIGEASCAPAGNAMLFDAFPSQRRARAVAIFQLGIPVGLLAAFFSVGWIVQATGSWRVPFFIAAVPGLLLAVAMLFLPEPKRGESDEGTTSHEGAAEIERTGTGRSILSILRIPTVLLLILAGIGIQVPTYAVATFLVPLLMRYFGLGIGPASLSAGVVLGVTGIVGLLMGGVLADRASRRSLRARLVVGAVGLLCAVPLTLGALLVDQALPALFVILFSAGWFFQYIFGTVSLPAIADVVEPHLRATAVAVYFAAFYLLGGAFGPLIAGFLSDRFAAAATVTPTLTAAASGLHQALLVVVPVFLLLGALAAFGASRTVAADHDRMRTRAASR